MTTWPPRRTISIASVTVTGFPEAASITTSAISPPVISATRSTGSSASTSITWSAPTRSATSSRNRSCAVPVTITVRAPAARAATIVAMPM